MANAEQVKALVKSIANGDEEHFVSVALQIAASEAKAGRSTLAEELRDLCLAVDADTVVFDNELSPGQQYNLEKLLGRTAIDRTAVILDIFAQNAHTLEGKAQVELALLRYRLPRLRRGADAKMSQQRGGVG